MHLSDVDALENSVGWKDIVEVLQEVRRGLLEEDLLTVNPTDAARIADIQGRISMIDFVLKQPDAQRSEIKSGLGKSNKEKGR